MPEREAAQREATVQFWFFMEGQELYTPWDTWKVSTTASGISYSFNRKARQHRAAADTTF